MKKKSTKNKNIIHILKENEPKKEKYRGNRVINYEIAKKLGLFNKEEITKEELEGCIDFFPNGRFPGRFPALRKIEFPNTTKKIFPLSFTGATKLNSIELPNSIKFVGGCAFVNCGFDVKEKYDKYGRLIAYKGFCEDMTCHGNHWNKPFQYEEGKTYRLPFFLRARLCRRGFHACINPLDCFNYYSGEIGKDVVFHEVYLEGVSKERYDDSKVAARKITIGREITISEMADIASGRKI